MTPFPAGLHASAVCVGRLLPGAQRLGARISRIEADRVELREEVPVGHMLLGALEGGISANMQSSNGAVMCEFLNQNCVLVDDGNELTRKLMANGHGGARTEAHTGPT